MRYADAPTVEVEVLVAAPIDRIWPLVTDINMSSRFSSEQQGCEWLDGAAEPVLGARFRGTQFLQARGEWQSTSTVTELEPQRVFGWTVGIGSVDNPSARWRFELTEDAAGTRLKEWAQMGPGPSGLSRAIEARPDMEERIVERRLEDHRTNMVAVLNGIKELAEATA